MTMQRDTARIQSIQQITGLRPTHFADLVRVAQLIDDPSGGVSGKVVTVNWLDFGIPQTVVSNLKALGYKYRYESPHVELDLVGDNLTPETRSRNRRRHHRRPCGQSVDLASLHRVG